jgi:hypothetical protein
MEAAFGSMVPGQRIPNMFGWIDQAWRHDRSDCFVRNRSPFSRLVVSQVAEVDPRSSIRSKPMQCIGCERLLGGEDVFHADDGDPYVVVAL